MLKERLQAITVRTILCYWLRYVKAGMQIMFETNKHITLSVPKSPNL